MWHRNREPEPWKSEGISATLTGDPIGTPDWGTRMCRHTRAATGQVVDRFDTIVGIINVCRTDVKEQMELRPIGAISNH
jgi:hypothetical protein